MDDLHKLTPEALERGRQLPPQQERSKPSGEPECGVCGGLGWLRTGLPLDDPDFGIAVRCECNKVSPNLGIPLLFWGCTFESFDLARNPQMKRALTQAKRLAVGEEQMLVLCGGTGLGKTHLAVAAVKAAREAGRSALFVEVPEMLAKMRRSFDDDSVEPAEEMLNRLAACDLLALDDLGTEQDTKWAVEQLYRLLNRRYTGMAGTIITSNAGVEAIDRRIRSRYRQGIVGCEGKDLR